MFHPERGVQNLNTLNVAASRVYVHLGPLDEVNGYARYAFPTPEAAARFAAAHQGRHPHRDIAVVDAAHEPDVLDVAGLW